MSEEIYSKVDAAVTGAAVTAYYAVPDFIESRKVRALVKSAIIVAIGARIFTNEEVSKTLQEGSADAEENPALLAGVGAGLTTLSVISEKLIYRAGERRKAAGARAPHTKLALVLGALCAISMAATNKYVPQF